MFKNRQRCILEVKIMHPKFAFLKNFRLHHFLQKNFLNSNKNDPGIYKEAIIIGIFSCFCSFSGQSGMETVITIISKWYLGWSTVENAVLFVASGSGQSLTRTEKKH